MPAIDDDAIMAIVDQHRHGDGRPNSTALASALGISRTTLQGRLGRLALEGRLGYRPVLPGFAIKQISEQQDADGGVQKTWIKQAPAGETFAVPEGHSVKGVSALVDASGATVAQWIKTKAEPATVDHGAIVEAFAEYRGKSELIPPPPSSLDDLLTLYPTADLHLGLRAWGKETGKSWDLKIAKKALLNAASDLIACAPPSKVGVFLDLGDQHHSNDQKNVTPASGHQLDVDGRFPLIAKESVKIRRELIEMGLQKHETIVYRGVPGNHDPEAQQWLSIAMGLFFENNPRVVIDDDPSDFWFYRHGLVMLAANHGHKTKPDRLPGVMASYQPKMWGATEFRYAFSGHIHHITAGEEDGAKWETLRTVAAKDAYSHQHGYSAGRELISITYHAERGEKFRQTVSV